MRFAVIAANTHAYSMALISTEIHGVLTGGVTVNLRGCNKICRGAMPADDGSMKIYAALEGKEIGVC